MFHNSTSLRNDRIHSQSSSLVQQDENALQSQTLKNQRLSSSGFSTRKDHSQNENKMIYPKTPLSKADTKSDNNNTGRRRRALGDISNKKGGLVDDYSQGETVATKTTTTLSVKKGLSVPNQVSKNKMFLNKDHVTASSNSYQTNTSNKKKVVSFSIHSTSTLDAKKGVEKKDLLLSSSPSKAHVPSNQVNTNVTTTHQKSSFELDDWGDIEICAGRTGEEERALLKKLGHYDDCNLSIDPNDSMNLYFRKQEEDKNQRWMESAMATIKITKEDIEREQQMLDEIQRLDLEDQFVILVDHEDEGVTFSSDDNFSLGDLDYHDEHILISGLDEISI